MLLTTPTSLSFLEESSLRTNNSSSHIISRSLIFITPSLSIFLSLSPSRSLSPLPLPPVPFFQFYCHCSVSSSAPLLRQSTLSLSSHGCIDFSKASPVISPYLLIPTLTPSLSLHLAGLFPFSHTNTISSFRPLFHLSPAIILSGTHSVFAFQI